MIVTIQHTHTKQTRAKLPRFDFLYYSHQIFFKKLLLLLLLAVFSYCVFYSLIARVLIEDIYPDPAQSVVVRLQLNGPRFSAGFGGERGKKRRRRGEKKRKSPSARWLIISKAARMHVFFFFF